MQILHIVPVFNETNRISCDKIDSISFKGHYCIVKVNDRKC